MDKLVKVAIVLGVLMAGFGVFYHYVIFVPGLEQQRQARLESEKREAEAQALKRQMAYESCIASARDNYSANWAAACVDVAQTRRTSLANCLADRSIVTNPYMGVQHCRSTYAAGDSSPNCTLPKVRADSINVYFKQEQDRCLSEAKSGL